MNILETQSCPECQSSLVDDVQNGEIICSGCGVVVADQMADYGPEVFLTFLNSFCFNVSISPCIPKYFWNFSVVE